MNENQNKKSLIQNDEDFVDCPKLKNSLKRVLEKYPEGIDTDLMAKLLLISESDLEDTYQSAVVKLRQQLSK